MTEEEATLTSEGTKVSFKSNLNQKDTVGNVSSTPGGFENIGTTSGGAISLLPSVAPPNDLLLVTDRFNFVKLFSEIKIKNTPWIKLLLPGRALQLTFPF